MVGAGAAPVAAEAVGAVPALGGRARRGAAAEDWPVDALTVHVRVVIVGRGVRAWKFTAGKQ